MPHSQFTYKPQHYYVHNIECVALHVSLWTKKQYHPTLLLTCDCQMSDEDEGSTGDTTYRSEMLPNPQGQGKVDQYLTHRHLRFSSLLFLPCSGKHSRELILVI